jgi:hypothetical protein
VRIAARARTRALAFLAPINPPKQVLSAALAAAGSAVGTGPGASHASRAAVGTLRTLLRSRCVTWHAVPPAPGAPPPPPTSAAFEPESAGALIVDPHVVGPASPYVSED